MRYLEWITRKILYFSIENSLVHIWKLVYIEVPIFLNQQEIDYKSAILIYVRILNTFLFFAEINDFVKKTTVWLHEDYFYSEWETINNSFYLQQKYDVLKTMIYATYRVAFLKFLNMNICCYLQEEFIYIVLFYHYSILTSITLFDSNYIVQCTFKNIMKPLHFRSV